MKETNINANTPKHTMRFYRILRILLYKKLGSFPFYYFHFYTLNEAALYCNNFSIITFPVSIIQFIHIFSFRFVSFLLNVPVSIFSVNMSGWSHRFLGITSPFIYETKHIDYQF